MTTPPDFDRLDSADLVFGIVIAALAFAFAVIGWAAYEVLR